MTQASTPGQGAGPLPEILARVAATGREVLGAAELGELLGALGVGLGDTAACTVDLRVAIENTREFGPVISAGLGGLDGALAAGAYGQDCARVHAAAGLTDARDFLGLFRRTLAYRKLAALAARDGRPPPDAPLEGLFAGLLQLAAGHARADPTRVLQSLELDPLCVADGLVAGAVRCTLAPPVRARRPRPVHKVDKLVHPASIGLVGVSATGLNFGRIILRNLMGSGYPKERLTVIRPGEAEIDGVRCLASLAALEHPLDLLIVAVAADSVPALVDEIIASGAVESVMLIPGGLGETAKSRAAAARLAERIDAGHAREDGGPVFLGANCLGVVSHEGGYDSWFIPLERLPKPQKKPARNSVLLSQSGAFMITRISHNPWLDPAYMLAVGNQTDLTHGDLLGYFAGRPGIDTLGIYVEGFRDGDGLDFVRAVRQAVTAGQDVVVYKAGATPAGAAAAFGHTASLAGDRELFDSVVRHAGAIVAPDFTAFDDLLYLAGVLHGKRIRGRRLGAVSGAGFEAVGMADSIAAGAASLEMAPLEPATEARVRGILAARRLDALVEVRNPIDINPGADDEAHLEIVEAFLDDPGVDAVIVGLDPTAPAVRALESSRLRPGYDIHDPKSTVALLPPLVARYDKPVIGVVDAGALYDAMTAGLRDQQVCVFRHCGRATQALARYVEARLYADAVRERSPGA
jgi:acyl-CoA synthetase (NDP forming)